MAAEGTPAHSPAPGDRHPIGISFGNSNSSIAYTTIEDKAEVIANEDGGMESDYMGKCRTVTNYILQIVKSHRFYPMSTEKSTMANKLSSSLSGTAKTLSHTSETS